MLLTARSLTQAHHLLLFPQTHAETEAPPQRASPTNIRVGGTNRLWAVGIAEMRGQTKKDVSG